MVLVIDIKYVLNLLVLQSTKVNRTNLKDPSVSVKFPSQIPPSFQNTHLVPQVIVPGNSLIPSSQGKHVITVHACVSSHVTLHVCNFKTFLHG